MSSSIYGAAMFSIVLASAAVGLLFQSGQGSGAGTIAAGSVYGGLTLPQQVATSLPVKSVPPEQLGDIFMTRKKYREALEQYRLCDQGSAIIANKTGIAYQQLLDISSAAKQYKRSTKLDAHYAVAFNNLGTIYYSQKSFRRAIHLYREALRLSPDTATVYSNLGSAYFAAHHFNDALASYQKALDLDPNVFRTSSLSSVLLQELSVEDKARFHYYMARVYALKGMNDEALQFIRKALEEGFKQPQKFREEPEFAALKGNPEFQQLMNKEQRGL